MSAGDRLSSLPDDLLRRILYFAPAREAESTSALSKRWRGLWCSTGAVNLDERVHEDDDDVLFFSRRDAFVSAARLSLEAAAAGGSPVTRLTFRVEATGGYNNTVYKFLCLGSDWPRSSESTDVVAELLSLPAARRVEELQLAAVSSSFGTVKFISLPSETLRVLDITSCSDLTPATGIAFPQLTSLRLSFCSVSSEHLQDLIHAAPVLATVHLESLMFYPGNRNKKPPPPEEGLTIFLHCPAATLLVLEKCCWAERLYDGSNGTTVLEIDAPRLRRFTYKGVLRRLSLSRQAPDLAWVELHMFPHVYPNYGRDRDARRRRDLLTFWQLLHNFSNAKELKLRVNLLDAIAVVGTASRAELMCSFRNLERMELEGRTIAHNEKGAALSIANLLQCCPMLRDLRINLTTPNADMDTGVDKGRSYSEKNYRHDLDMSIHAFNNRTSTASTDYDDDSAILQDEHLSKLPAALTGHVFECLQSSLTCVRLQFRLETNISRVKLTNTFGVKLIKFFAENAMLLKEMFIDAGNQKMCGHINSKVQKWSSGKSFLVLPLERS